jgi:hypothetical protein
MARKYRPEAMIRGRIIHMTCPIGAVHWNVVPVRDKLNYFSPPDVNGTFRLHVHARSELATSRDCTNC